MFVVFQTTVNRRGAKYLRAMKHNLSLCTFSKHQNEAEIIALSPG